MPEEPAIPFSRQYGPFQYESELELPELKEMNGSGRLPVSLRLGQVPPTLHNAVRQGPDRQFTDAEFLLEIAETGRFYVQNGEAVVVQPSAGAPESDLSIYLLGSVFGALCHQRGLLPLHASSIEHRGEVTAFLGNSGAGKSTLAAFLRERGYRVFSDDICLLEPTTEGLRSAPLAGWLKLWQESFTQIGVTPREQDRTFSTDEKFRMYLPAVVPQMLKVRNFVFLERAEENETEPRLETVSLAAAVAGLLQMIYPGYRPGSINEERRLFRQCAEAMTDARASRLVMPWGWAALPATLDLIELDLLDVPK